MEAGPAAKSLHIYIYDLFIMKSAGLEIDYHFEYFVGAICILQNMLKTESVTIFGHHRR